MTLDYYLVRHDLRILFHLGASRDGWSTVFPVTDGSKIRRFGGHLLGQLPMLVSKVAIDGADSGPEENAAYRAEVVRRIQTWADGAPGVYCINDSGDHFDFVTANKYRITGTRYARQVGPWWLDEFDWEPDKITWVVATNAEGARVGIQFPDTAEGHAFYRSATVDQIEHHRAVLEVNDPKIARA